MSEKGIDLKERETYRKLAKELERMKESISLLIQRIQWIEEEVFPEMEGKVAGLVNTDLTKLEDTLRAIRAPPVSVEQLNTLEAYIVELLKLIRARGELIKK